MLSAVNRTIGRRGFVLAALLAHALIAQGHPLHDIGTPTLAELYVSPTGNDTNPGTSPGAPLATLTAAWNLIPTGTLSATGYRINLLPGVYTCEPGEPDACFNYFNQRSGTHSFPIIIRAANGPGTATLRGGLNLSNVSYLYLIDLNLVGGGALPTNGSGNNLLHLDSADHVLLRGLTVAGPDCPNDSCNNLQEVLKVNQTQYLYVENSTFSGAWHSVVDYMVVQYGHILGNHLHTAGQWCMYIKGGSAYQHIEDNELEGCQLGFQAGQSANLAMMVPPWLQFEVYDIKFVNNLLHDIPGTGLGVAGGYNILYAHNTLYRVATDPNNGYPMLQMVLGERNCTPTDELHDPELTARCRERTDAGGWGPDAFNPGLPAIPNRNVYVYNNVFYNPPGSQTLYATLAVNPPTPPPDGFRNIPNPLPTDANLAIRGNIIWDGGSGHPLGVDDTSGCAPSNPTCNPAQLAADNHINEFEPAMVDPGAGDFHPIRGGNLATATTYAIPDFVWSDFPLIPAGNPSNLVAVDRNGEPRPALGFPGAYAKPSNQPPTADAGPDRSASIGEAVSLLGSGTDPDHGPSPLAFSWAQPVGQSITLNGDKTATPSFTPEQAGVYTFFLTVNDGLQNSPADSVAIAVQPKANPPRENRAPIANAGADRTVTLGTRISLDGRGSSDPDTASSPLVYRWTQSAGPTVALGGADTATPGFFPEQPGTYTFSLTVSDGLAASSSDSVSVAVEDTPLLVLAPNGGETWKSESVQTIRWYASSALAVGKPLKIQYSRNGGKKWTTLRKTEAYTGLFRWRPKPADTGARSRIRICLMSARPPATPICDASDGTFVIQRK